MKPTTMCGSALLGLLGVLAGCGGAPIRGGTGAPAAGQGAKPAGQGTGATLPAGAADPAATVTGDAFPLARGAEWSYRGTTRSGDDSGRNAATVKVTWTMKVLDLIERAGWHAAVMQGHPRDVVNFGGEVQPSEYLIVWKQGRYYEPIDGAGTMARLRDPKDALAKLVSEAELFLVVPPKVGDSYCAERPEGDDAPSYCWTVESTAKFDRAAVAGAPPAPPGGDNAWALWLRTRPDHSILSFVSGLGFVAFLYQHHGTISEAELTLTSFRPGKP